MGDGVPGRKGGRRESFSQVHKIKLKSSAHFDEEIRMISNFRKAFVDVAEILALK
jgi:hypothetical protein